MAGNPRRRRFPTETPLERELRLENQSEQLRGRQETRLEQREYRFALRRRSREQETEDKDFARFCGTGISSYEKDSIKLPQKLAQPRINGYRQKQDIGRKGSTEINGKSTQTMCR